MSFPILGLLPLTSSLTLGSCSHIIRLNGMSISAQLPQCDSGWPTLLVRFWFVDSQSAPFNVTRESSGSASFRFLVPSYVLDSRFGVPVEYLRSRTALVSILGFFFWVLHRFRSRFSVQVFGEIPVVRLVKRSSIIHDTWIANSLLMHVL